jgi:ABC-type nitrate/sulfonate/bicarbonate transport system substrate-binding protein
MRFRSAVAWLRVTGTAVWSLTAAPQTLQKVTVNYPTKSGASWPMFLAKEGGYYRNNGLDVTVTFSPSTTGVATLTGGQAQMANSSMEQALQASSRDPSVLVSMGSSLNKGQFALMGAKTIGGLKDLKGKRIAVSMIGDAPYNYTIALLAKAGLTDRDVRWIQAGTDAAARAAALQAGAADATLLTAPAYFRMEEAGYKVLAQMNDYADIYASTVYLFTRKTVAADPKLPERLIKAQSEAIKRFYEDKAFAVKAYLVYDSQKPADVERIYDLYAKSKAFERVPYVLVPAVKAVVDQADAASATAMRSFKSNAVVDNTVVDRLVQEGYFEKLYRASITSEQDGRAKMSVR